MAKIAGIGRRVLLNSLENWAKTARDPRENENSAGLAAGETSLSRFLATRPCAAVTYFFDVFPICVGQGENRAKLRFLRQFWSGGRVNC